MDTTDPRSTKSVSFHTLGCRLNFSETGSIADGFKQRGYKVVPFGETSDAVFLNTCTVTDGADSTCRNLIRKAQKTSPEAKIVVAGCYAQMEAEKISKMMGVDMILGTSEKYKVFEYLDENESQIVKIDKSNEFWGASTTPSDKGHTRAFLKIQDGCNYICSFCIIPFARGRSRTITVEKAIEQTKDLVKAGYKEIVLTGVNIGEYESTSGESLSDLVKLVADVEGVERLRLGSVEPNTYSDELLETLQSTPEFLPHFHIPLQSGSDTILKSMRRKYDSSFYKNLISKIKTMFPNASFGADIIVGYPGETEDLFLESYEFIKDLPLTHFHIFPYSKRKNTTAAKLDGHVQHQEKKRRLKLLEELEKNKRREYINQTLMNSEQDILFEEKTENGWKGLTPNFIPVYLDSDEWLKNQILKLKIESYRDGFISASI